MTRDREMATGPEASLYRIRWTLDGRVHQFLIREGTSGVGSQPDNAVVIADTAVSRRHAVLRRSKDRLEIEDLGSTNGTFVNGQRVRVSPLSAGDKLRLGSVPIDLDLIDPEEAEIAIPLAVRIAAPEKTLVRQTGILTPKAVGTDAVWMRYLAGAVRPLALGKEGSRGPSLEELRELLEAAAVVHVGWDRKNEPLVREFRGGSSHLHALPALLDQVSSKPIEGFASVSEPEPTFASVATQEAGGIDILAAIGVEPSIPGLRWLLKTVHTLLLLSETGITEPAGQARQEWAFPPGFVAGSSMELRRVLEQLHPFLDTEIPILITGETGTGKEMIARAIHLSSSRRKGPFQAINCAAVPAELLEAELFGIEKGTATGVTERAGLFQIASGGVLFLDEVAEMPQGLQTKLLRVLQTGEVYPVGSRKPSRLDARIVSATNAPAGQLVSETRLRADVFYRLAGFAVELPPLRCRKADIPVLAEHFLSRFAAEVNKEILGISLKALRQLVEEPWPGNVRQLENEMRRLALVCPNGGVIEASMLERSGPPPATLPEPASPLSDDLRMQPQVDALEKRLIAEALSRTGGNRSKAADLLGISRDTLRAKVEKLGIAPPEG
ncbi:MAG: sigma 54-interacting transcriptional regulator [Acidobacteria bacterium]|nr:sigma 54-interacting transcriptional regulator [Acidobacteriota bacterium]MCK6682134.1 sigma 54-interacting transcriptional regulator [Thermoanaerobaculia bacterium]